MKLYHQAPHAAADRILEHGFQDAQGGAVNGRACLGVRLQSRPPRPDSAQTLLVVDVPEILATQYECAKKGAARTFLLPAAVVNLTRVVRCYTAPPRTAPARRWK